MECEVAFQALKSALCTGPVLISPDFKKEFIVQTDASDRGLGAVLSQFDDQGNDRPVAYYSHKLLPREEKYSTECLAITMAVQTFHPYLMGRKFRIQTDHRSLEWLNNVKDSNPRLTRWSLFQSSTTLATTTGTPTDSHAFYDASTVVRCRRRGRECGG